MTESIERWRSVLGWEGFYEVSDHGRVRSLDRLVTRKNGRAQRIKGQIRKLHVLPAGYLYCMCCRHRRYTNLYVHRMVLEAFVSPCPDGMQAAHNDGDRQNNRLSNLRWDTCKNNHADKNLHGTMLRGEKIFQAKLSEEDAREVFRLTTSGEMKQDEIAAKHGITQSAVSMIKRKRNWAHLH